MIDYQAARAVAMVVQTGSFERAAKALHVTPSAISQRVKQLEERLGLVLIERGAPCVATEKGEWLCRHMDNVGMLEAELAEQLPGLSEPGHALEHVTLNIATTADSLATWFLPALSAFSKSTDYLLNIAIDDQEHTGEWLERGRVLAAVTSMAKPVPGCQVIYLGKLQYVAAATPEYAERYFSAGLTADTLRRASALTFNQKDRLQATWTHRVVGEHVPYPTHWLPSVQSYLDACLGGMGWGLQPLPLVVEHLAEGRLVDLAPAVRLDVELFWQISRLSASRLAALSRSVVAAAHAVLG